MNEKEFQNKRIFALEIKLANLEARMEKIDKFLPNVELWLMVLAEQFKLNRTFILSLDKKPEVPKDETKTESPDVPVQS